MCVIIYYIILFDLNDYILTADVNFFCVRAVLSGNFSTNWTSSYRKAAERRRMQRDTQRVGGLA